jgi:hypothetical protein
MQWIRVYPLNLERYVPGYVSGQHPTTIDAPGFGLIHRIQHFIDARIRIRTGRREKKMHLDRHHGFVVKINLIKWVFFGFF